VTLVLDAAALREGDEVTTLELQPGLAQVVRYCALIWAFPDFFFDLEAAKRQGMPGTIVPGPLKVGLIYRAVDEWLGGAGVIRLVRAAHRRPDQTNRPISIVGRVAKLYEEDGRRMADLEMAIINEEGQPSVRGLAMVEFRA
jgi:hydroxyacyl-ACP dehydratase HTD2-like protein with hotdog domain